MYTQSAPPKPAACCPASWLTIFRCSSKECTCPVAIKVASHMRDKVGIGHVLFIGFRLFLPERVSNHETRSSRFRLGGRNSRQGLSLSCPQPRRERFRRNHFHPGDFLSVFCQCPLSPAVGDGKLQGDPSGGRRMQRPLSGFQSCDESPLLPVSGEIAMPDYRSVIVKSGNGNGSDLIPGVIQVPIRSNIRKMAADAAMRLHSLHANLFFQTLRISPWAISGNRLPRQSRRAGLPRIHCRSRLIATPAANLPKSPSTRGRKKRPSRRKCLRPTSNSRFGSPGKLSVPESLALCRIATWRPFFTDGRSRLRAEMAAGGSKFWPWPIRHGSGRPVSDGNHCSSLNSDGRRVTRFAAISTAMTSIRCMKLRLALCCVRRVSR